MYSTIRRLTGSMFTSRIGRGGLWVSAAGAGRSAGALSRGCGVAPWAASSRWKLGKCWPGMC